MRGDTGLIAAAVVVVPLVVWWVVMKVRAGASGVSAHRALQDSDRYYRQLVAQAEADRRMGDPNGFSQWRADIMLLDHLEVTGKLSPEEAQQGRARVDARFKGK